MLCHNTKMRRVYLVSLPGGFVLIGGRRSQRNRTCANLGVLVSGMLSLSGGRARESPVSTSQRRQLLQNAKRINRVNCRRS